LTGVRKRTRRAQVGRSAAIVDSNCEYHFPGSRWSARIRSASVPGGRRIIGGLLRSRVATRR
jgi:hypothetical protein